MLGEDAADDRAGVAAAANAVIEHRADDDLGRLHRRKGHRPDVLALDAAVDILGGAGLAGHAHALNLHRLAGAAVDHHLHSLDDRAQGLVAPGQAALEFALRAKGHQARTVDRSAGSQGRHAVGHLQGCGRHEALADGALGGVGRGPGALAGAGEARTLPLGARHQALSLAGEVDAGARAEAGLAGGGGDGLHPNARAQGAEVGVAGLHQRFAQVQLAVAVLVVAAEAATEVGEEAGALEEGLGVEALLLGGDGDEGLEDRARGVLGLDGAVEEGLVGVVDELLPGGAGDGRDEGVEVVGGGGGEDEEVAIARVEGHHGARTPGEGRLGRALEGEREGEGEVAPLLGVAADPAFAGVDARIDAEHHFAAVAGEEVVVLPFEAGAAARVGQTVIPERAVGRLFGALAHVAEGVGGEGTIGVDAPGHRADLDPGELLGPLGEVGHRAEIHIAPGHQGDGAGFVDVAGHLLARHLADQAEARGELVDERIDGEDGVAPGAGLAEFLAVDDHLVGGAVVSQHLAVAVEDAPAQAGHLYAAQALALLDAVVAHILAHLHPPQPRGQHPKARQEAPQQHPERPAVDHARLRLLNLHGRASPPAWA